jgi:DNA-binding CsgD family transcriptional regulator
MAHRSRRHRAIFRSRATGIDVRPLSPREIEVLRAAGAGLTAKETADLLGISPAAVNLYMSRATIKMGVKNKTEAVVKAMHKGIIG